ncbi:membrane protein [Actinomycetes bacterium]|nr:membrane protein [Actinomycetes bacterium]
MAKPAPRRQSRLDQPLERGLQLRGSYDPEVFGRLSERVARRIGSWAFIAWMSVVVVSWVAWNSFAPIQWRVDPFPFIFLTLLLSLQASYAAPLILLAQYRQADRDRVQYQEDRARTDRLLADSDYLAREIAALRLAIGEVATRDYVHGEIRDLLADLTQKLDRANAHSDDPA